MEQQTHRLYWDKHRIPVNLTIIFSLLVAVYGLYNFIQGAGPLLLVAGLGVGAYSWFTNPRQYWVYPDALVIVYGSPRTKVLSFSNVSHLEMRALATPDRLRVWPYQGRRIVLLARDPDKFNEELQQALDNYRKLNPVLEVTSEEVEVIPPSSISADDGRNGSN